MPIYLSDSNNTDAAAAAAAAAVMTMITAIITAAESKLLDAKFHFNACSYPHPCAHT